METYTDYRGVVWEVGDRFQSRSSGNKYEVVAVHRHDGVRWCEAGDRQNISGWWRVTDGYIKIGRANSGGGFEDPPLKGEPKPKANVAIVLADKPESIASAIMQGLSPHMADPPCECVLCSLPRGGGWSPSELEGRIATMGREAHLSLMAVAAFALGGRRPGDTWGTIRIALGSGKKFSGFKAIGIGSIALFLSGCGGIAVEPAPEISAEPPAIVVEADAGADRSLECVPREVRACSVNGHGFFQRCYSDGMGWGPCI